MKRCVWQGHYFAGYIPREAQSDKKNSAANDLSILEEVKKEKMSEELRPATSNQLAEVAMKY